ARRRDSDTASGILPAPPAPRRLSELSRPPGGRTLVRCIVCPKEWLSNSLVSVTAAALLAVSVALSEQFRTMRAGVPADLAAEVTVAIPEQHRTTAARNAFHNAGVDLHPNVDDLRARAEAISRSLDERRRRLSHPAFGVGDRVTETVPAAILRRDVDRADLTTPPTSVAGHTVVSSVNRGEADLALDGHRVLMTAGFPALSPAVGVTHGVHGIGDVVTLTAVTSEAVLPDADAYAERLRAAVERVREALR
ncbi:MAG: WS/DGAT domain-containing protein, partial [Rhodococcus sp. (in: high G+C Gram-positive bacteria)]